MQETKTCSVLQSIKVMYCGKIQHLCLKVMDCFGSVLLITLLSSSKHICHWQNTQLTRRNSKSRCIHDNGKPRSRSDTFQAAISTIVNGGCKMRVPHSIPPSSLYLLFLFYIRDFLLLLTANYTGKTQQSVWVCLGR